MEFADPARIDRQIEETAQAVVRWRQRLRENQTDLPDPFSGRRGVSSRAAWQSIQRLPDGLPTKASMVRWVAFLTIERVTMEDIVEFETARRANEHQVKGLGRQSFSLRSLGLEAVFHPDAERRAIASDGLVWRADDASSNALWWQARRQEAALQLGLGSLAELEAPFAGDLTADRVCAIVLDETEDLARDVLGTGKGWHDAMHLGTATEAVEGWPARLTTRWLQDLFGATPLLHGLRVTTGPVPPATNGASFARALARFGAAVHRAAARALAPSFTLAEQPFDAAPASYGALFASLLASESFLRRRFGLGDATVGPQQRALAKSLLLGLRVTAAKAAVASRSFDAPAREAHALWVSRATCSSAPPDLAGLLPRYDPRSAALVAGALEASARREEIVQTFDHDWFDNPRGQQRLREVHFMERLMLDEARVIEGAKAAVRFLGEPFR